MFHEVCLGDGGRIFGTMACRSHMALGSAKGRHGKLKWDTVTFLIDDNIHVYSICILLTLFNVYYRVGLVTAM